MPAVSISRVVQQGVEQGRFSGVSLSDDRHRHASLDGIAGMERVGQTAYLLLNLAGQRCHLAAVGKLHILLAEVQFQFHQRHKVQQSLVQGGEFAAQPTSHLVQCQSCRGLRLCGDDIGHRLGL